MWVCEVRHWGEIAGQFDSPIIIGRLTIIIIIIIIVLYINSRMSLISSWLSTKTFAIVDISDYRRYTILWSIGTTLMHNIRFGSVSSHQYPIRRKCQYRTRYRSWVSDWCIPILHWMPRRDTTNPRQENCCCILFMTYWHKFQMIFNGHFVASSVDRPWQVCV